MSFQISIPLNNQEEGPVILVKGNYQTRQPGSQSYAPYSKNENADNAASPVFDRTQLLPSNRGTAVQLSAFTQQPARETHPRVLKSTLLHGILQRETCFETFLIFISHLHEHSALSMAHLTETACPVLCQVILTTSHDS